MLADFVDELEHDIDSCLLSLRRAGEPGSIVAMGPALGSTYFEARFPQGRKFAETCDRLVRLALAETCRDTVHDRTGSRYELRIRLTSLGIAKAQEVEAAAAA